MNILKLIGLFVVLLFIACHQEPVKYSEEELTGISDEVREKIINLGFSPKNALKLDSGYVVEGDIFLSNKDLISMPNQRIPTLEQYRTSNVILKNGDSKGRVIYVSLDASATRLSIPLKGAIDQFNKQKLAIIFKDTPKNSKTHILISVSELNGFIARAGFPTSLGDPFNQIIVDPEYYNNPEYSQAFLVHTIAHELGHCIGFRHTDLYDNISCGEYLNEGSGLEGAIHISGTTQTSDLNYQSWMLACYGKNVNRPFNNDDIRALKYLYNNNFDKPAKDVDGNVYHTVKIGTQIWMVENLKTTKYRDKTSIPHVSNDVAWINDSTGAYCNYNNNSTIGGEYGKLYNYYAVTNPKKLAPTGWHIPSDAEWSVLISYLGGVSIAANKLKETGSAHWRSPNSSADNSSGFTGLPGGYRGSGNGGFIYNRDRGVWWTSTAINMDMAWVYSMVYTQNVTRGISNKPGGFSVRCIKD